MGGSAADGVCQKREFYVAERASSNRPKQMGFQTQIRRHGQNTLHQCQPDRQSCFFVSGSDKSCGSRGFWQDLTHCLIEVLQLRSEFICESSIAVADQSYVLR